MTYGYDAGGRLVTVTDWNTNQTTYAYDNAGRLTTTTLPNGVVSSYSYDLADRLTGVSHAKAGVTLASASYGLDGLGGPTQQTDLTGTRTYAFDNLHRLTSVSYPGPTTTSYTYDAFGNRLTMVDASGTTSYAYNDIDQLLSVTPPGQSAVAYGWDANGNLTSRGSDTFSWNSADRLTSATVGGTTTSYAYNGDGLRHSLTVGGNTRTFTWDVLAGNALLLDDGTFRYVYGLERIAQVSTSATSYYLSDGLGSTAALTDSTGTVTRSYDYDAFGTVRGGSGSAVNDFQFTGEQVDASTGLQFLRARYFDATTGRLISRDPYSGSLANPQSLNRYVYALADPISLTDPSGLSPDLTAFWQDLRARLAVHKAMLREAIAAYKIARTLWTAAWKDLRANIAESRAALSKAFEAASPYAWQCIIWGAQGAIAGSAGGVGGAVVGGFVGCGTGIASRAWGQFRPNDPFGQCLVWAAGAMAGGAGSWTRTVACGGAFLGTILDDDAGGQCAAWSTLGLAGKSNRVRLQNFSSGCVAGIAANR